MHLLRQRERDERLSGTDSLEALRRRCGDDAPKAAACLNDIAKVREGGGGGPNPRPHFDYAECRLMAQGSPLLFLPTS